MTKWKPISREAFDRIKEMAAEYAEPPMPRAGYETIALYDRLRDAVMLNLGGLLAAADRDVQRRDGETLGEKK